MEPAATVRFDFTESDFIGFNLYHHRHSPSTRAIQVRFVVFILAIGLAALVYKLIRPEAPDVLWSVPLGCGIGAALFPFSFRRSLRRNVLAMLKEGRNRGLLGTKEVTLTPAEIRSTGAMGMTTTAWPAVERVVVDGDVLYLYISSVSAVVVPRRAFAQDADFEAFVETARKYQVEAAARSK